jgi:hypothetical protein
MPPDQRPRRYVVDLAAPYDLQSMGHAWKAAPTKPSALGTGQYLYDGDAPGYSVTGHRFLCDLPEDDRRSVVEFLKTL